MGRTRIVANDLSGRTTSGAATHAANAPQGDDESLLLSRRHWLQLAWTGFHAASILALAATGRLERARIVLGDDGQIVVDKSRTFHFELGQWSSPDAFLKA